MSSTRPLRRVGLDPASVMLLKAKGMNQCKDLFFRSELTLLSHLDIPKPEVTRILDQVSKVIVPSSKTAFELSVEMQKVGFIPTGLHALDQALRGGLACASVTEVVGASGVGKSTFCMTACCLAVIDEQYGGMGGNIVYIDTEDKFSAKRLLQIANERLNCSSISDLEGVASRCILFKCATTHELGECLSKLESVIIERQVRLVVVDSMAALVRREFDRLAIPQRQEFLSRQASCLKALAENFKIAILVSNQVTGGDSTFSFPKSDTRRMREGTVTAALGNTWAHCVNTRIALEELAEGRRLTIAKCPLAPVCHFQYLIDSTGLQLTSDAIIAESNHWSAQLIVTAEDLGTAF